MNLDYLTHFAPELLALGRQDETSKLHELISWASPFEGVSLSAESISSFIEVIKKNVEKVSPMSHELVTAIRALKMLLHSRQTETH